MSLNDVLRNLGDRIGVFWSANFDQVPQEAGVYAWFYPLRITTTDLAAFLSEVRTLVEYDARLQGPPIYEAQAEAAWHKMVLSLGIKPRPFAPSEAVKRTWEVVIQDQGLFDELRENVMRASIFGRPLYVGKADNLLVRCHQHIRGTAANDFHSRYETYAASLRLQARSVRDLVFACITVGQSAIDSEQRAAGVNELLEEILKYVCHPPYSLR